LIPKNPKKKKKNRKFIHLKSSIKLANEKEINKIITYTHRETLAPLLVQVVSIFEKFKKQKHEIYTQTTT
jgi:hypothetical protein